MASGTPLCSVCVVFYVVNGISKNRIQPKSREKEKKTPEIRRFQVCFWSCWADLNRPPHPYQAIFDVFCNNF